MFKHQGMWLPDGEKHFPDWMTRNGEIVNGRGTYQIKKFREAMRHVNEWSAAVDVGAHVGFWTMQMAARFGTVHAFEPVPQFAECWRANVADKNALLYNCALGASHGMVAMRVDPADSGGTHVTEGSTTRILPLDDYLLSGVGFIKIDCEGFELEVLKGAADTLSRCRPCVIVEQKPHKLLPNFGIKGAPAVDFLLALGYRVAAHISGDYVMVAS
jgi:FkbM family methyltransferase